MKIIYEIVGIEPYINKFRNNAQSMLNEWKGCFHTHALFDILDANNNGDDLIIDNGAVFL